MEVCIWANLPPLLRRRCTVVVSVHRRSGGSAGGASDKFRLPCRRHKYQLNTMGIVKASNHQL